MVCEPVDAPQREVVPDTAGFSNLMPEVPVSGGDDVLVRCGDFLPCELWPSGFMVN